jgi:hypothetical protein
VPPLWAGAPFSRSGSGRRLVQHVEDQFKRAGGIESEEDSIDLGQAARARRSCRGLEWRAWINGPGRAPGRFSTVRRAPVAINCAFCHNAPVRTPARSPRFAAGPEIRSIRRRMSFLQAVAEDPGSISRALPRSRPDQLSWRHGCIAADLQRGARSRSSAASMTDARTPRGPGASIRRTKPPIRPSAPGHGPHLEYESAPGSRPLGRAGRIPALAVPAARLATARAARRSSCRISPASNSG